VAVIDAANKTLTIKLVYYGCALGGKTTNLVTLHRLTDPEGKHGLVSIATNDDRTLFFDLLPMELGQVGGLGVKVKVYTVPGQVHYELTRRQVLQGTDGVVLVVDSLPDQAKANAWALQNLRYNLRANGLNPDLTPIVVQWNKRDVPNARSVDQLRAELNPKKLPEHEAVATTGDGVVETFAAILKNALSQTYAKYDRAKIHLGQIEETVDRALAKARSREPKQQVKPAASAFSHRVSTPPPQRDQPAEGAADRRAVDQEALFSESVSTTMMLAEKLDSLRDAHNLGDRRSSMMRALSRLAPLLADPAPGGAPRGVMALLLEGASRGRGSLLLFRQDKSMEEREVLPRGPDPLNGLSAEGLGSVAYQFSRTSGLRVIEDLDGEIFFGQPCPGGEGLECALFAPLTCDGTAFGSLLVYSQTTESPFDPIEREYWTTASCLLSLSLHWHTLRTKLSQAVAS
jgi:hypothetical protein